MTALRQAGSDIGRDGVLHLDIAALESLLGETWPFKRGLWQVLITEVAVIALGLGRCLATVAFLGSIQDPVWQAGGQCPSGVELSIAF